MRSRKAYGPPIMSLYKRNRNSKQLEKTTGFMTSSYTYGELDNSQYVPKRKRTNVGFLGCLSTEGASLQFGGGVSVGLGLKAPKAQTVFTQLILKINSTVEGVSSSVGVSVTNEYYP